MNTSGMLSMQQYTGSMLLFIDFWGAGGTMNTSGSSDTHVVIVFLMDSEVLEEPRIPPDYDRIAF